MDRSWTLPAVVGLLALENVAVVGSLLFVRHAPPLVVLFLLVKFPVCASLMRRRPGAFLFLTLWESSTLVIAVINPSLTWPARLALAGSAAGGLALLGASLPLFPPVELPGRIP